MVEVEDNNNMDDEEFYGAGKVPGEDDEPDLDPYGDEEEEEVLVPVKARKHGGLFGADLSSVKF